MNNNSNIFFITKDEYSRIAAIIKTPSKTHHVKNIILNESEKIISIVPIQLSIQKNQPRLTYYGKLIILYDLSFPFTRVKYSSLYSALLIFIALIAFSIALSFTLHQLVTKRMNNLLKAMDEFAEGKKPKMTIAKLNDEIKNLLNPLNK